MITNASEVSAVPNFLTVSQAARRLNVAPKKISDAFYARKLDDQVAPVVVGRRMIPESYLAKIAETLREAGVAVAAEAIADA